MPFRRPRVRYVSYCLITIMFLSMFATLSAIAEDEIWYTRNNSRIREEATEKAATVVIVPGGEAVTVTTVKGEWSRVRYGAYRGYIRSDLLVQLTKSGYIPLQLGNECKQVRDVKERLSQLSYYSGTIDENFTEDLVSAVMAFQKQNGLKADGIAGGETQKLLFSDKAKSSNGSYVPTGKPQPTDIPEQTIANLAATGGSLKSGSKGDYVVDLQRRLKTLGYITFTADGIYGSETANAIKTFQMNNNLVATGTADAATLNLIMGYTSGLVVADAGTSQGSSDEAVTAGAFTTLKKGDSGDIVKRIQVILQTLGYLKTTPDGKFGSNTETAVAAFQRKNNLAADGKVGEQTYKALTATSAIPAVTATPTPTTAPTTATASLKQGDKNDEVKRMQQRLRDLGYLTSSADGTFGSATKLAVIAFQQKNGLSADGIAGSGTLKALYASNAIANNGTTTVGATPSENVTAPTTSGSVPNVSVPNIGSVRLMHFQNSVKPKYGATGTILTLYDPNSGLTWRLRVMSMGRHADCEPLTASDTANMRKAFGGVETWTPKAVWVKFPDGVWSLATTHDVPHLSQTIKNNDFNGHLCVHFLRDMDEVTKNDPNYGVQHQKAIRAAWKALTGQVVD